VCIGAIVGAYGIEGEVRLRSFCADPPAIASYGPLWCENASRRFSATITRQVKGGFAARLTGVGSREQADGLRGTFLYVDRAVLPDLPDEEFYQSDLVGLEVLDTDGTALGLVHAVLDFGAGDILEVRKDDSEDGILLPFTASTVPTVDLAGGRIIVDPPDGLLSPLEKRE